MFQGIRSSGSLSAEAVSNIKEYGRPLAALFSLRPHSFLLRKKRMGAPGEEKKENSETGSANRAAIASEEASSIPFPPGRRKLHIRSLLLPSQIVTVSLGHNLAIWNFTTPHAILMMAGRRLLSDTVKTETFLRRKSRARLWSMESPEKHSKVSLVASFFSSRCDTVLFFLRIEKEKNGVAKFPQPFSCCCFLLSMAALTAASWKYSFCFCFRSRSCSFRRVLDTFTGL